LLLSHLPFSLNDNLFLSHPAEICYSVYACLEDRATLGSDLSASAGKLYGWAVCQKVHGLFFLNNPEVSKKR